VFTTTPNIAQSNRVFYCRTEYCPIKLRAFLLSRIWLNQIVRFPAAMNIAQPCYLLF